ncbi:MAG: hypothetical protein HFJ53_05240 [Clostridia bacterium]|jgi:hypothetical protein|nr:hypothetical protein [Clostridia bacterium]
MNNNKTLENMLWIFIPNIAKIISNRKGISLKKADEFIYNSSIYKKLENKNSKMWYYSDEILADFFINEYEKNELYGV